MHTYTLECDIDGEREFVKCEIVGCEADSTVCSSVKNILNLSESSSDVFPESINISLAILKILTLEYGFTEGRTKLSVLDFSPDKKNLH